MIDDDIFKIKEMDIEVEKFVDDWRDIRSESKRAIQIYENATPNPRAWSLEEYFTKLTVAMVDRCNNMALKIKEIKNETNASKN